MAGACGGLGDNGGSDTVSSSSSDYLPVSLAAERDGGRVNLGQGKGSSSSSRSHLLRDHLLAIQRSGMAAPVGNGGSVPLTVNDGNASSASSSLAPRPQIDPDNHVVMLDNCERSTTGLAWIWLTPSTHARAQMTGEHSLQPAPPAQLALRRMMRSKAMLLRLTTFCLRIQLHLELGEPR